MASSFDHKRFGGPIGRMLLEDQQRVLLSFLGDVTGRKILDVGAGTGRASIAIAGAGATVVGVDASAEMLAVARRRASDQHLHIDFAMGDAHALAFADRAFDGVVCLRLLMHVPDWQRTLAELCRVARDRVVFDYPSLTSAAALQAVWRRAAAAAGSRVEAYRVFTEGEITRALTAHGFHITRTHRQFVLPIALHKALGSTTFTQQTERLLEKTGLLQFAGSPVTVAAER